MERTTKRFVKWRIWWQGPSPSSTVRAQPVCSRAMLVRPSRRRPCLVLFTRVDCSPHRAPFLLVSARARTEPAYPDFASLRFCKRRASRGDERIEMNGSSGLVRRKRRNPAVAVVRLLSLLGFVVVRCPDWATSIRQGQVGTPMHKVEFTQKGYIQVRIGSIDYSA